jgi:glycosyltransferase involved in cell wall biosynthesis
MTAQTNAIRVLAMIEATTITGPAKNFLEFAKRATQSGADRERAQLSVLTFVRPETADTPFIQAARCAGIPIFTVSERLAFDPRVLGQLRDIVSSARPDIIQSHAVKSHFLVRVLRLHRVVPWIAFNHGYTTTNAKVRMYNQLDRWSLKAPDRIVTVCAAFARQLRAMGVADHRITIRHNMVQPFSPASEETVAALRARLGIAPNARVVFCAGRLSHEKGHADLMRATAMVREQPGVPPFTVVVAGDGPERLRLEALRASLGLEQAFVLAGHQSDLRPFFSMSELGVLPSHSEGSPNFLLESMAAGVPVVAMAVGGVPEIATDREDTLLVPKGNTAAMARSLAELLRDDTLRRRLATNAQRVTERFTPEAYCRSLVQLYRETAAARRV